MKFLPPSTFKPAGTVISAKWSSAPAFAAAPKRRTGRRAQGVRYERKVHEHLAELYPDRYVSSPWIRFTNVEDNNARWCQPDGLIIDLHAGEIVIVEVKYQHTSDAWWQLEKLYKPVLKVLFPPKLWSLRCVEVVKWFDPMTNFPVPTKMSERPTGVGDFSVHIWKP